LGLLFFADVGAQGQCGIFDAIFSGNSERLVCRGVCAFADVPLDSGSAGSPTGLDHEFHEQG
jgi:hypothetical protein